MVSIGQIARQLYEFNWMFPRPVQRAQNRTKWEEMIYFRFFDNLAQNSNQNTQNRPEET